MSNLEMKVDALVRLVTAEDGTSYDSAKAELLSLAGKGRQSNETNRQKMMVKMIEDTLTKMGMPNAIRGFRYCTEAVQQAVEDPKILGNLTKRLYPSVAEVCGTTAPRAEQAIRHGVEAIWTRGNPEHLNEMFGYSVDINRGKPTNSEFVARISNLIRRQFQDAA